jgi:putative addiction module component (TIGR02574 family)
MIDPKDLLQEAMKLPPEARAALAGSLLASLDDKVDADAEAAWAGEIERRIRELDQGAVKTVPWNEARRTIRG